MVCFRNRKVQSLTFGNIVAAFLLLTMISMPVSAPPIVHESGPHDWITTYMIPLPAGFWADYEGETIIFRMGIKVGNGDIVPFGDIDGVPPYMATGTFMVDPTTDSYYRVIFAPFTPVAYPEKGSCDTTRISSIHPDQETVPEFGFLALDHHGTPKRMYEDVGVYFQFKLDNEAWLADWIPMTRGNTVNLHVYAHAVNLYGQITINSELSGYLFGIAEYNNGVCNRGFETP